MTPDSTDAAATDLLGIRASARLLGLHYTRLSRVCARHCLGRRQPNGYMELSAADRQAAVALLPPRGRRPLCRTSSTGG